MTTRWRESLDRSDVRLALFGLAGAVAVVLGFVAVPVGAAEELIKRGGYHLIAATVALFAHALWRLSSVRAAQAAGAATRAQGGLVVATIGVFSVMAILAEPYHSKILNDEFVLQSTAFNLHYFRDVATMVRGYDIQGVFLSTDNYLDKRPYLYPFLVSLVHDLTGYRIANAFLLNSALYPLALALAYGIGRRIAGWRSGWVAVLLLGTLPLLGQNATGSGMELVNIVMILAAVLLGANYLERPDEPRLAAFVLGAVVLAQARYESALHVVAAAAVVVLGWWREGRIILPWSAVLAPLLLVPRALHNKVLSSSPVMWELKKDQTTRFSADYVAENLRGAADFLLHAGNLRANSPLLTVLGGVALLWALIRLAGGWRRVRTAAPTTLSLACFGGVILANTVLVMFYYWSNFDDPMASRFALPGLVLAALVAAALAAECDRWLPATLTVALVAVLWAWPVAARRQSQHYYSRFASDEIEWQRRVVAARPAVDRLILTNRSSLPWLLQKTPSIMLERGRLVADRLQHQMTQPTFREILVFQTLVPTSEEGDHAPTPESALPPFFRIEPLAERRFGMNLSRISRLTAVDLPADWEAVVPKPPAKLPPAGE